MERLGFLQLAKRFLLLGKEATTTTGGGGGSEEDPHYIQPAAAATAANRPPAGRTLSLKIFNRVQTGGGGGSSPAWSDHNGGMVAALDAAANSTNNNEQSRSSTEFRKKKKFHSVKEGTRSTTGDGGARSAGRKENADPRRLRIASVGRKHVFSGGGGVILPPPAAAVAAEAGAWRGQRRPVLLYQEYTTRVAQIPGMNIMVDLSSPSQEVKLNEMKAISGGGGSEVRRLVMAADDVPGERGGGSTKTRPLGAETDSQRRPKSQERSLCKHSQGAHGQDKKLSGLEIPVAGRHPAAAAAPDKMLSGPAPHPLVARGTFSSTAAAITAADISPSPPLLDRTMRTVITLLAGGEPRLQSSRASSVVSCEAATASSRTRQARPDLCVLPRHQPARPGIVRRFSKSLGNLSSSSPMRPEKSSLVSLMVMDELFVVDDAESEDDEEEDWGASRPSLGSRLSVTAPGSPAAPRTSPLLALAEAEQLKKYLKDLREGNWTPRPPRKFSLKIPERRKEVKKEEAEEPRLRKLQQQSSCSCRSSPPAECHPVEKTVRIRTEMSSASPGKDDQKADGRPEVAQCSPEERLGRSGQRGSAEEADRKAEKRSKSIHRKLSRMGGGRGREEKKDVSGGGEDSCSGDGNAVRFHHPKLSRAAGGWGGGGGVGDGGGVVPGDQPEVIAGSRSYDVIDELTRNLFGEDRRVNDTDESLVEIDFL